ncbi:MAG: hypothetical protein JNK40_16455 [Chromatiales bacterium]|nr:hypothetical protein [Chromatiales bacterium]
MVVLACASAVLATPVAAEERQAPDLQSDVEALQVENAAMREQLRRLEEQQQALLELVERLQRGPGAASVAAMPEAPMPSAPTEPPGAASVAADVPVTVPASFAAQSARNIVDRYQDGIVVWQTPADAEVPFLLKFNVNTQVRYLNTLDSEETFTDHLGVVREVNTRNDITVNRTMFILGGYIFDPRLRYSSTVWTSAGAASIVVAGTIGWQFSEGFTLTGGYTGVPGSRSLVDTFPFFTASDRSMADNFFRPGFTQGIWAKGEPIEGLSYLAFVGNGLNTLNLAANKIDENIMYSGSVWWEPLGDYGEPGKSRNMYDDYFADDRIRIRLGTAFTRSREDRFSNLDQSSPENTSLYNSDGVLTFATGAFAPGVTVEQATYRMWAIDAGLKWRGLAVNGQYFFRWVDDFEADGPLPIDSMYDHGFELSASYFVRPRQLAVYGRGSRIDGEFGDSWEYAAGVKWYFVPTERAWVNGELMRVRDAPYSGTFTPYTSGLDGWVPMLQGILAF